MTSFFEFLSYFESIDLKLFPKEFILVMLDEGILIEDSLFRIGFIILTEDDGFVLV